MLWSVLSSVSECNGYLEIDSAALAEPLFKLRNGDGSVSVKEFKIAYAVTNKSGAGN
jgi:hypothetical protein